jgi:hypothetical protein
LERELRGHRGDIKVLNAGVNGYSVSQMMARTRTLLACIKPKALGGLRHPAGLPAAASDIHPRRQLRYPMLRPTSALMDLLKLARAGMKAH